MRVDGRSAQLDALQVAGLRWAMIEPCSKSSAVGIAQFFKTLRGVDEAAACIPLPDMSCATHAHDEEKLVENSQNTRKTRKGLRLLNYN
jgi:hypothetical protein